jgi:hypothetical protein
LKYFLYRDSFIEKIYFLNQLSMWFFTVVNGSWKINSAFRNNNKIPSGSKHISFLKQQHLCLQKQEEKLPLFACLRAPSILIKQIFSFFFWALLLLVSVYYIMKQVYLYICFKPSMNMLIIVMKKIFIWLGCWEEGRRQNNYDIRNKPVFVSRY